MYSPRVKAHDGPSDDLANAKRTGGHSYGWIVRRQIEGRHDEVVELSHTQRILIYERTSRQGRQARPMSVDRDTYEQNWTQAFASKCDCLTWAIVDFNLARQGNGHNPNCDKFKLHK